MAEHISFEGKEYVRDGGEWWTADFEKPPLVVVRELERLRGSESKDKKPDAPPVKSNRRKKGGNKELSILAHVEPEIAEIIRERFAETGDFVKWVDIVQNLLIRPHIRRLLEEAYNKSPGGTNFENYAGIQVNHFSRKITQNVSEFEEMFERMKIDDKWAYRPVDS